MKVKFRMARSTIIGAALTIACLASYTIISPAHAQQASNGDRGSVADRGDLDRGDSGRGPRRWPTDTNCGAVFCEPSSSPTDPVGPPCGAIAIPCDGGKGGKDPLEPHIPNPTDPSEPPKPKPKPKPTPTPVPPMPEPNPGEDPVNKPHPSDDDF